MGRHEDALLEQFPLYGLSPGRIQAAVYELYSTEATFKDPLSIARGREEIIPLFQAVKAFFPSATAKVLSITENDPQCPPNYPDGSKVILVEAIHYFKLKPSILNMPFRMLFGDTITYRAVTKYVLDANSRVLLHEELWSMAETAAFAPLGVGTAYNLFRTGMGKVFNTSPGRWILERCTSRRG